MNQSLTFPGTNELPVTVELLNDDELSAINGGITPVMIGVAMVGGMMVAGGIGIAVGVAFYYFSRDE